MWGPFCGYITVAMLWATGLFANVTPQVAVGTYDAQMRALQTAFCGVQKQSEIKERIQSLVKERVAALPAAAQTNLAADYEPKMVAEILAVLWHTFHINELCVQEARPHSATLPDILLAVDAGAEISVVKFAVLARFLQGLFAALPNLPVFASLLNPFGAVQQSGGMSLMGWSALNMSSAGSLSPLAANLGSNGALVSTLFAGILLTTLSQIVGIIVGLHHRHRYPVLGYSMITAAVAGYTIELLNWFTIALGGAAHLGGSDLLRVALILGVSPTLLSGVMIGVSGTLIVSMLVIAKYLQHQRELRVSAHSLIAEGFLDVIKGQKSNLLDELLSIYPRKAQFDRRIEKMKLHIEQLSLQRIKLMIKTVEKRLAAQGKEENNHATSFGDYLPDRETFSRLLDRYHHYRQVKKFKNELANLHTYIAKNDTKISLTTQDARGAAVLRTIFSAKFLKTRDGLFTMRQNSSSAREALTTAYLESHSELPVKKIVKANIVRLKYNEKSAKRSSRWRWEKLLSEEQFAALKQEQGLWFKIKHIFYGNYLNDVQCDLEVLVSEFIAAKLAHEGEKMTAIAKRLLKELLLVPKEERDIGAGERLLVRYAAAVQSEGRVHLKKRALLDIVDMASCTSEIDFLCGLGEIFYKAHFSRGAAFSCPLSAPASCVEL